MQAAAGTVDHEHSPPLHMPEIYGKTLARLFRLSSRPHRGRVMIKLHQLRPQVSTASVALEQARFHVDKGGGHPQIAVTSLKPPIRDDTAGVLGRNAAAAGCRVGRPRWPHGQRAGARRGTHASASRPRAIRHAQLDRIVRFVIDGNDFMVRILRLRPPNRRDVNPKHIRNTGRDERQTRRSCLRQSK